MIYLYTRTVLTFYQSTTPLAHMNLAAPKVFLQRMSKQLTPRERAWLFAPESEPERLARFYRLWVRAPTAPCRRVQTRS